MSQTKATRQPYGSTRRRIVVCVDKTTERLILEAQDHLESMTGAKPSLAVAVTFLVKHGHKATVAEEQF
jgi:hypothetical protein